jgi:hypothetical protein
MTILLYTFLILSLISIIGIIFLFFCIRIIDKGEDTRLCRWINRHIITKSDSDI